MDEKKLLLLFGVVLLLFVGFTTVSSFHDSPEYYQLTRLFAGQANQAAFSGHAMLYPFLMHFVLVLFPASFLVLKLVNVLWIVLTALLLFWYSRKTLWLFVFSPLVWMTAPEYTPVLPAMFFLTAMFLCFERWSLHKEVWKFFVLSALAAGCAFAFYTPALIMIFFFVLAFLRKESLQIVLLYLFFTLPVILVGCLLDWYYTGMPIYSLIRYFGVNLKVVLGASSTTPHGALHGLFSPHMWLVFVVLAPLLFLLFRLKFKKNLNTLLYLVPCFLFFFIRSGLLKYFLLFSPVILLLLTSCFEKKDYILNAVFSVFFIVLFTFSYFGVTDDVLVQQDLAEIHEKYDFDRAIIALRSSYLDWSDVYYVWDEEYALAYHGEQLFSGWSWSSQYRADIYKQLVLRADLVRYSSETYDDVVYWIDVPATDKIVGPFVRQECFRYLCIYEKSSSSS